MTSRSPTRCAASSTATWCWTARIGERGRYPAVDVLRSLSRTVPGCLQPAERALMQRARRILALQAEMADLVRLGAYRAGTDPAVDEALRLAPRIEAMLAQGKGERSTVEEAFAALAAALEERRRWRPDPLAALARLRRLETGAARRRLAEDAGAPARGRARAARPARRCWPSRAPGAPADYAAWLGRGLAERDRAALSAAHAAERLAEGGQPWRRRASRSGASSSSCRTGRPPRRRFSCARRRRPRTTRQAGRRTPRDASNTRLGKSRPLHDWHGRSRSRHMHALQPS